ncbi:hypothetical protein [Pseudorhodobacter wandonensis]|uniref:hypothetical protein n=1 Tax=Pseudorhodobacter wandonensis TaxID=1120568 RepID=UPI0012E0F1D9|nr:hypothetical protein [Pseudorhodobacter wandonensis]
MNNVQPMEDVMLKQLTALLPALGLTVAPALAGGSSEHSAQAGYLSGQASSQSSQAIASGAAAVVAVPLVVFGAGITISGAALAEVGTGSMAAGSAFATTGDDKPTRHVKPDGAPRLD